MMRRMLVMTERQYRALVSLLGAYVVESAREGSPLPVVFILATDANDEETTPGDLLALVLNDVVATSDAFDTRNGGMCPTCGAEWIGNRREHK